MAARDRGGAALEAAVAVDDECARRGRTPARGVARKQGHLDKAGRDLAARRDAAFRAATTTPVWGRSSTSAEPWPRSRATCTARERYQESLVIRERLGDRAKVGALYSNLAVVAEYDGDLAEARRMAELALDVREEVGDVWGVGVSQTNLGAISNKEHQFEDASRHLDEAIRVMRQVGDLWFVASAQQLRGVAARGLGDIAGARDLFAEACRRSPTSTTTHWSRKSSRTSPFWRRSEQHHEAIELVEAAARLRDEVGTPLRPRWRRASEPSSCRASRPSDRPMSEAADRSRARALARSRRWRSRWGC